MDTDLTNPMLPLQLPREPACDGGSPCEETQRISEYLRCTGKRFFLISSVSSSSMIDEQHEFGFMNDNVIGILRRSKYTYLDYGVFDTFRTEPKCRSAALRIQRSGTFLIGQLVQMAEADVKQKFAIDDATIDLMKAHLARADLRFNMRIPGWETQRRTDTGQGRH